MEKEEGGVMTLRELIREERRGVGKRGDEKCGLFQFLSVDSWIRCVLIVVYSYDS
jgi:hypothetical protein